MAKHAVKQHDKVDSRKVCEICNQAIKLIGVMKNGKIKMTKQCNC